MKPQPIDWTQLWYPGPTRVYTPDEMARAGSDAPSATLVAMAGINFALLAFAVMQVAPPEHTARLTGALVALAVIGNQAGRWLWWRPWRRSLMWVWGWMVAFMLLMSLGIRWRLPQPEDRLTLHWVVVLSTLALTLMQWFLVVWRSQQIEARLNAQQEREKAIEMARRLAAAQIEPHFLFNTLAGLQHWVQTQDERAAPLLAALTGYLRATLPLFDRPLLAAGDELLAIERYLQVMQARLGPARLQWRIDVDTTARAALLPPGLLLTLVENAVQHGVEPRLSGGELRVQGATRGDDLVFEVRDNGPGTAVDPPDGTGLANIRQRLALSCGPGARLSLEAAAGGGCRAEISIPLKRPLTVDSP